MVPTSLVDGPTRITEGLHYPLKEGSKTVGEEARRMPTGSRSIAAAEEVCFR
jgi:hypothetical protein